MRAILLSADHDRIRDRILLKFYNEDLKKVVIVSQKYEQRFYIAGNPDIDGLHRERIYDSIRDREIDIREYRGDKVYETAETYGGWESNIRSHQSYLFDEDMVIGAWYDITKHSIKAIPPEENPELEKALEGVEAPIEQDKFTDQMRSWARLLDQPVPDIRRIAMDIETDGDIITAVGFYSDTEKMVYTYNRGEKGEPKADIIEKKTEEAVIRAAFSKIMEYPVLITYNGEEFDLPYLCRRAGELGIQTNPFILKKKGATLKRGIHIDLYQFLKNKSIQGYAFGGKYKDLKLDTVCKALLGEGKLDPGDFNIPMYDLANYCLNDTRLTYDLTTYQDGIIMTLIIMLARISKMPIDDVCRFSLSYWAQNMFQYYMRRNGILIPNAADFEEKTVTATKAKVSGKKYEGALVIKSVSGVHWGVSVLDFASLYPTIIKRYNASFETIRCPHEECRANTLPGMEEHWSCTRRIGIAALLLGSLMDIRVRYYKPKGRDDKRFKTIEQTLKVMLNGSYGVMGFENFQFYFVSMAESITGIGREILRATINAAENMGTRVLYGDTDSCFLDNPSDEVVEKLISMVSERYGMTLEKEKTFRYIIMSGLKKNYLGIKEDGSTEIKGLTGKKSHTPPFLQRLFNDVCDRLAKVEDRSAMEAAKGEVSGMVTREYQRLNRREIPMADLAFATYMSKSAREYEHPPEHVRVALTMNPVPGVGDKITYVKTKRGPMTVDKAEAVDIKTYEKMIKSTLDQVLHPLDIRAGMEQTLDTFFG